MPVPRRGPPARSAIVDAAELHRDFEAAAAKADEQYPDGYYLDKAGKLIALLVRTPVSSGDIARSRALLARVQELIAEVDPKRFD